MKAIVTFSGGKDSLASLLWVRNNLTKDFITVFCDTGWEHPLTYKYIEEIRQQLGLNLVMLKSKKFDGMVDLARKKTRWPSSQRRFCTSELKTIPTIDYILDEVDDDILMIQGIRAAESAKRAEMQKQCTYFKYYVQPYGKDKNGKDKFHTYRRKDVLAFREKHADDLLQSAAVDLQEIIHRADPSARLLLMEDVKQIARLSNNIVRNVDAFHDDEFSATFGDLADLVALNVRNIIYTERAKEKRKAI